MIRVPHEIRKCHLCGLEAMANSDVPFKGIQMDPRSADVLWFCNKKVCREEMDKAIERAKLIWAEACS